MTTLATSIILLLVLATLAALIALPLRVFTWPSLRLRNAAAALGLLLVACEGTSCAAVQAAAPTLESVISRVDVPRLLECANAGAAKDVARCLGARVLTQGLQAALDHATKLAEDAEAAGNPAAGADDLTAGDRARLAVELDQALDTLAVEIADANALADSSGARL